MAFILEIKPNLRIEVAALKKGVARPSRASPQLCGLSSTYGTDSASFGVIGSSVEVAAQVS
jgi:hypothetical protein